MSAVCFGPNFKNSWSNGLPCYRFSVLPPTVSSYDRVKLNTCQQHWGCQTNSFFFSNIYSHRKIRLRQKNEFPFYSYFRFCWMLFYSLLYVFCSFEASRFKSGMEFSETKELCSYWMIISSWTYSLQIYLLLIY